ncbi:hypothetical protein KIN20_033311 [Parelaphostrongylus tenuis]|uniref:Uncharacterized protein n=1 Tax=Parelaphostrongylus tenuis TaxID=148309 RepID=A0AAD5R7S5_PARTN|nr:hypothetical protein KIN20_033311 [Parelaphostrongylus tenuis]
MLFLFVSQSGQSKLIVQRVFFMMIDDTKKDLHADSNEQYNYEDADTSGQLGASCELGTRDLQFHLITLNSLRQPELASPFSQA